MNENIEMKPVVDLMGATKKVLANMAEFFEKARDDAKDRMISPDKFWAYLTKELKTECKIQDDQLLLAGMPTQLVMDTLELDEAEAAPTKATTLTYKNLYLTMKDKSTKKVPIDQVAAKIAPFTKNFKSAMEALVMGDPEAILKVFQHVYGKDVEQWSVPAEESAIHSRFSALAALALSEMYRVAKFNMPSCMYEMKEGKLLVNDEGVKKLVDGFDKSDRAWLVSMFPHVVPDYLHNIINETKSVLNELPKEVVDKLFVNINPEYLKNLKESELKELAAKFVEAIDQLVEGSYSNRSYNYFLKNMEFVKGVSQYWNEKWAALNLETNRTTWLPKGEGKKVFDQVVAEKGLELDPVSLELLWDNVWELRPVVTDKYDKFAEATQPKPEEVTEEEAEYIERLQGIEDIESAVLEYSEILSGSRGDNPWSDPDISRQAIAFLKAMKRVNNKKFQQGFIEQVATEVQEADEGAGWLYDDLKMACKILGFKMPKISVSETTQPTPEEVTKAGGKMKAGTVGKQALPVGPTVKGGIANKKYPSKMAEAEGGNVWCLIWSLEEKFWVLGVYLTEKSADAAKSALETSSMFSDLVGKGYEKLSGEPPEEIEEGMLMVVDKESLLAAVEGE